MTIFATTNAPIAMFPIIPHHFFKPSPEESSPSTSTMVIHNSSVSPSTSEERSTRQPSPTAESVWKVTAGADIPRDTISEELQVEELGCPTDKSSTGRVVKVSVSREGRLRPSSPHPAWVKRIRLAGDCHSYNVLLRAQNQDGSALVLQVVRAISTGEELLLWFSEQLLALMAMPFLVPANIQGEKRYVCHLCGRHFEIPNPLKIHLALECGRLNLSCLWKRLGSQVESRPSTSPFLPLLPPNLPLAFQFQLRGTSRTQSDRPRVKVSGPTTARHSAFKPYWNKRRGGALKTNSESVTPLNYLHNLSPTLLPNRILLHTSSSSQYRKFSSPVTHTQTSPLLRESPAMGTMPPLPATVTNYNTHAAEMETLVSNLGKSKQGHLCIYCGKIYSRKYGLKIHIRTHTGYKPLKCKYCLRPFGDPSNLNKHVRLHAEGETPYKCDLCGKVLVRRRDLERHIKSRHTPQSEDEEEIQNPSSN